jgi:DNA N-6-adenine-methyltransferase (Dam)
MTRSDETIMGRKDSATVARLVTRIDESMKKGLRVMPAQKPGRSKQDYSTPPAFLDAVRKRFGFKQFDWDLAATKENAVDNLGGSRCYFGPDHRVVGYRDALASDWFRLRGNLWLNPEFADIGPWAAKCNAVAWYESEESKRGPGPAGDRVIYFLVPASVGSNWFAEHVDKKALVLFPSPRLSFDGKNPYPKDVLMACYGLKPGYACWRWKP